MLVEIGIAVTKETPEDIIVAAVAWPKFVEPPFPKRGLTLQYMKENMLSVLVLKGTNREKVLNVICSRTVEKLLVKQIILSTANDIKLLVKPALKRVKFRFPHECPRKHWLLNAADKALQDWMRGNR
jgi:hypothetical protein